MSRRTTAILALAGTLGLSGCGDDAGANAVAAHARGAAGDPERGKTLIGEYGCGACHTIPGVHGARGMVGPPLTAFGRRTFIAGALPNEPKNLVRWITGPPNVEPGTAMPDLGVSPEEARHIAAYLYTLR